MWSCGKLLKERKLPMFNAFTNSLPRHSAHRPPFPNVPVPLHLQRREGFCAFRRTSALAGSACLPWQNISPATSQPVTICTPRPEKRATKIARKLFPGFGWTGRRADTACLPTDCWPPHLKFFRAVSTVSTRTRHLWCKVHFLCPGPPRWPVGVSCWGGCQPVVNYHRHQLTTWQLMPDPSQEAAGGNFSKITSIFGPDEQIQTFTVDTIFSFEKCLTI